MLSDVEKCSVPLKVVVVGAGIGGLSAAVALARRGHSVRVLEASDQLLALGAGVVIPPPILSWFQSEGVFQPNDAACIPLDGFNISRWETGEVIVQTPANPTGKMSSLHRGDLQSALLARARKLSRNIEITLGARVVDVDLDATEAVLASGDRVAGDLIIAADGVKSTLRPTLCPPEACVAQPSGEAAYRIILPRELLEKQDDDALMALVQGTRVKRWDGPQRHAVAYPVRNHELLNAVLIHPDDGRSAENWTSKTDKRHVFETFAGWDPLLHKIISLAPDQVLDFRMFLHLPSPVWTKGSTILLGDACHAMLPYLGQGVAQAVEDVSAITAVLSTIDSRAELPHALKAYETSRKSRVEQIQAATRKAGEQLHLSDGEAQAARDRERAAASETAQNSDVIKMQHSYWHWDAAEAARSKLEELRKQGSNGTHADAATQVLQNGG